MTMRIILLALTLVGVGCSVEDGAPDPPIRQLVRCSPDAAPSDPLACPDLSAAVVDLGAGAD
jgi:hypothetical protein